MLRSCALCAGLLATPFTADVATAAVYDVTVVGTTANTLVTDADACATGERPPRAFAATKKPPPSRPITRSDPKRNAVGV